MKTSYPGPRQLIVDRTYVALHPMFGRLRGLVYLTLKCGHEVTRNRSNEPKHTVRCRECRKTGARGC